MKQPLIRRVLFVCTGNICRSPMAEAVFRQLMDEKGVDITCDSAGTHAYHVGERPDPRTLAVCAKYGVPTDGIIARQVENRDFADFDLILGMDRGHVALLTARCPPPYRDRIRLFGANDVPDPYYGGMEGFEEVYAMVLDGCHKIV